MDIIDYLKSKSDLMVDYMGVDLNQLGSLIRNIIARSDKEIKLTVDGLIIACDHLGLPRVNINWFEGFEYVYLINYDRYLSLPSIFYTAKFIPSGLKVLLQIHCCHDHLLMNFDAITSLSLRDDILFIFKVENNYVFVYS
ncbi:hypothetical protein RF11_13034 [Thelohanellus kitauei]|uniref:Uncharacterized protein n=1 Tax=Thelohanellus kitauei TaxID=669202 RepID=A0A0C2MXV1_THEKT|nr:hypothetical protein RF11_13034 [Thelohanellus kitauei]